MEVRLQTKVKVESQASEWKVSLLGAVKQLPGYTTLTGGENINLK